MKIIDLKSAVRKIAREKGNRYAMIKCVVEMYGLPREISELREVEVELRDGASLEDLIAALRRKIPSLEGDVICTGNDKLTESYAFNVNGDFCFGDSETQLQSGDRVALLVLATGG